MESPAPPTTSSSPRPADKDPFGVYATVSSQPPRPPRQEQLPTSAHVVHFARDHTQRTHSTKTKQTALTPKPQLKSDKIEMIWMLLFTLFCNMESTSKCRISKRLMHNAQSKQLLIKATAHAPHKQSACRKAIASHSTAHQNAQGALIFRKLQ